MPRKATRTVTEAPTPAARTPAARRITKANTVAAETPAPAASNGNGAKTPNRAPVVYVLLHKDGETTSVVGAADSLKGAQAAGMEFGASLPPVLTPGVPASKPKWAKQDTNHWAFPLTSGAGLAVQKVKVRTSD